MKKLGYFLAKKREKMGSLHNAVVSKMRKTGSLHTFFSRKWTGGKSGMVLLSSDDRENRPMISRYPKWLQPWSPTKFQCGRELPGTKNYHPKDSSFIPKKTKPRRQSPNHL